MRTRLNLWGGGGLAALYLTTAGCHPAAPPAFAPPPAAVTVVEAFAQDVPVYLDEIGQGAAFETVTITPQVSGLITARRFEDGADLEKGRLLFEIDARPFQAQLDAAQAALAQSKAALALAKIQLEMYASVNDLRAVSKSDYDTKKNAVDVDEALMRAAQAAVETANLNLEYCQIHSPIAGRAGRRLADAGNVVMANQTPLLSVQRLDPFYADFTITERELPEVQKQMARGTLKTRVWLPSEPETNAVSGELTFLDNVVRNGTGTVSLRATLANAGHHFWPGQFVRVRLVLEIKKGAVLVPNEATQISQQGPFVYVVKTDDTAELRLVTPGQSQGDSIVMEKGVAAGERVVVTGQLGVVPGGKVRIEARPAPPAPGQAKL
jgi:multidrug efflux system membrane fusion protein